METKMVRVELNPDENAPGYFTVHPIWANVDRPNVGGWGHIPYPLAVRLKAALEAGVALGTTEVRTDIYGETYVNAEHLVSGKRMNADLNRLGF